MAGDDCVGDAREQALERDEQRALGRGEVTLEHVPVVGVHHQGAPLATPGQVVDESRGPRDQAGLGHVRVDDRRPVAAHLAEHREERAQVMQRRDRTAQGLDEHEGGSRRREVAHVAFAAIEAAVNQDRIVASFGEPRGERDRLNRRPTDVQARDRAEDAHRNDSPLYHFGAEIPAA